MNTTPVIVFLSFVAKGAVFCQADMTILPFPYAYVEENTALNLTCSYTGSIAYNLGFWYRNGIKVYTFKPFENCSTFGSSTGPMYKHSCINSKTFLWTILSVLNQDHGVNWSCNVNTNPFTWSLNTSVFVQVPVKSVSFSTPAGSSVTVTENTVSQFVCETSAERPRSTIQWYINNRTGLLGGGSIAPTTNYTLASTVSTLSHSFIRTETGRELYCTAFNIDGQGPKESVHKGIIVHYGTDGGPIIDGFASGEIFKAIVSIPQSLTCYVTGGNPAPTLSWDCFSITVSNESGGLNEVRKRITWTPSSNSGTSTCSCTSNQTVSGIQVSTLTVDVLSPPSNPVFTIVGTTVNETIKGIRGRNMMVKCVSSGNPDPSYEWNSNISPDKTSNQSLRLPNVQISDEGAYTCTATNKMEPSLGSSQTETKFSVFILDILFPPDTPTFRVGVQSIFRKLAVVSGDNVAVTCITTSDPGPPSFQWTGQFVGNSNLIINNIQSTATKTCTARNTMYPTAGSSEPGSAKATLNINVMNGPTVPSLTYMSQTGSSVVLSNTKLVVIKGASFSITCSGSTSKPGPPSYSWSGRVTSDNYTVSFTNIDTSATGSYTCNVENTMIRTVGAKTTGKNNKSIDVEIQYPPVIQQLQDQYIVENQPMSLNCTATSDPQPSSYTWTRSKDSFSQQSSTLTITHTRRDDTDNYTCTARNEMHPTVAEGNTNGSGTDTVQLKVLYRPDVAVSPINGTTITEGDVNVMLLCSAYGEPQTYTFDRWIHYAPDGHTKIQEYTSFLTDHDKAYLKFPNTTYMDSGLYVCGVSNGIPYNINGSTLATNNTMQVVRGRPVIIESEPVVASASHQNATLWVTYYSNDGTNTNVKWYRIDNGSRHEINNQENKLFYENSALEVNVTYYTVRVAQPGNKTELYIQNVSQSDFGAYEIEISNSINRVVTTTVFLAQGAPDPPKIFAILQGSTTSSSAVLSWVAGFHGGADQTFYIQYNTSATPWQNKTSVAGGKLQDTDFNATVDQLSAKTQYFFRIFAANEFGRSEFSTSILTATTEEPNIPDSQGQGNGMTGPAVGGGIGGAVVIIGLVVLIVFFRRRNLKGGSTGTQKKTLLDGNKRNNGPQNEDDLAVVQNAMYISADSIPSSSITNDEYAQVDKSKKQKTLITTSEKNEIYSQVQKPRKTDISGKKSEISTDVYSIPMKVKGKQKPEKKQKQGKKTKQGTNKDESQGKINEGMVYENADTLRTNTVDTENAYELTQGSAESSRPTRTKNPDGLIYVDVDLPKVKDGKDKKPIIHGLDDRSDYADIAFGKIGEHAPDSEEEEQPKENVKEG